MKLAKDSLAFRLGLLMMLSLFGTLLLSGYALYQLHDAMEREFRDGIRNEVQVASGIVKHFHGLESSGALSREQAQQAAKDSLRPLRYGGENYFYVFGADGSGVMHPVRADFEGRNLLGQLHSGQGRDLVADVDAAVKDRPAAFLMIEFPRPGSTEAVPKLQYLEKFEPWGWVIGSGVYMDDINAAFHTELFRFGGVVLALMVVLGGAVWAVTLGITRQLGGEPGKAAELMGEASRGNLRLSVGQARAGSMLAVFKGMLERLREMMGAIGGSAERVAETSHALSGIARDVASAARRQSDATTAIAAAVEEMTVSINHISEHARDTEADSAKAARVAEDGEGLARSTVQEMQAIVGTVAQASGKLGELVGRTDEIGSIANVIKEIAAQTNLLALNAAIEAARAGEHGRGFAVVADEVRGLAGRTASATVQIEQMIHGIQDETHKAVDFMSQVGDQVDNGVRKVESAAESLASIRGGTTATLARIREVAEATREQSSTSSAIAQQVEEIARMVEDTSAAMDSAVRAVEKLEGLAADLHREVGQFSY